MSRQELTNYKNYPKPTPLFFKTINNGRLDLFQWGMFNGGATIIYTHDLTINNGGSLDIYSNMHMWCDPVEPRCEDFRLPPCGPNVDQMRMRAYMVAA